jgi:hypothetical protein
MTIWGLDWNLGRELLILLILIDGGEKGEWKWKRKRRGGDGYRMICIYIYVYIYKVQR